MKELQDVKVGEGRIVDLKQITQQHVENQTVNIHNHYHIDSSDKEIVEDVKFEEDYNTNVSLPVSTSLPNDDIEIEKSETREYKTTHITPEEPVQDIPQKFRGKKEDKKWASILFRILLFIIGACVVLFTIFGGSINDVSHISEIGKDCVICNILWN